MTGGPPIAAVSALPAELTSRGQYERLLAGALAAVSARGYPATTVAHIVAAAGVSRATFYEVFSNKEECVLATYDLIADWLGVRIAAVLSGVDDWTDAVRAAVKTVLASLDAEPRMACFCAVEILCLGRVGFARYEASIERLAAPLRAARAECSWGARLPPGLEQTTVGGVVWLVGHRARPQLATRFTELAPDIVFFLLAPYLDPAAARRAAVAIGPVAGGAPLGAQGVGA